MPARRRQADPRRAAPPTTPPTTPSAASQAVPTRAKRARPTRTLKHRLILWSVVVVVVPTFTCAVAMNFLAYWGMAQAHERSTEQLTRTVAGALSGRLSEGFGDDARAVVDRLRQDERVALIEVSDAAGQVLYRPINDPEAWNVLAESGAGVGGAAQGETVSQSGHYALVRKAIYPTLKGDPSSLKPEGFLTLGVRDRDAANALWTINLLQFGVASVTCLLVVLLTAWVIARWTAPLLALRQALVRLNQGHVPEPIRTDRKDDLGRLCEAFNSMVKSLVLAQKEIQQSNTKLERQVKQRTAELRQLNDKLEAEANDKNEFLRAVSHDLNAPLRNIAGMSQMLMMKYKAEMTDDAIGKLERISANAKHQSELISDLLELSKLRSKEPRPEKVDLSKLVRRIIENLEYDLQQAKIVLTVRGRMPEVYVEKNRIRQVLQNLIDNAVKYMMDAEERKVTVAVKRKRDFEPDVFNGVDVWQFSVSDTGRGISEEDIGKVFQVFARATHSGTHVVAGRGVGLASVKTIVESYGGRIWVESTLGLGSTFSFTLPVERVSLPEGVGADDKQDDAGPSGEDSAELPQKRRPRAA